MLLDKNLQNLQLHEVLETGLASMNFEVPCGEPYVSALRLERYIQSSNYEFIIKMIEYTEDNMIAVDCKANIEELEGCAVPVFDAFNKTSKEFYEYCVSFVPSWTIKHWTDDPAITWYNPLEKETLQEANVCLWDMIQKGPSLYSDEIACLWFDTKNKVIEIKNTYGKTIPKLYVARELAGTVGVENTLEFATILYPIGKNGLTIELVNPTGQKFLENYKYSTKHISKFWKTSQTRLDKLYSKAKSYLNRISKPSTHYNVILMEPDENIQLGNTIQVLDEIKQLKIKEKIVAIHRFPYEPENTILEIGERTPDITRELADNDKLTKSELEEMRERLDKLS